MSGIKLYYGVKKKLSTKVARLDERGDYPYNKQSSKISAPMVVTYQLQTPFATKQSKILDLEFGESTKSVVTSQQKITSTSWTRQASWAVFLSCLGIFGIIGSVLISQVNLIKENIVKQTMAASAELQAGANNLKQLKLEDAAKNFRLAENNFAMAENSFVSLGQEYLLLSKLPLDRSQLVQSQAVVSGGKHLATSALAATSAIQPITNYWQGVQTSGGDVKKMGTDLGSMLSTNSVVIKQAFVESEIAHSLFGQIDAKFVDSNFANQIVTAKAKSEQLYQALKLGSNIADRLPDALGFNNPKYYLILNQNPNEARATGGFIGSYILLKLYQGKLENVFVDTTQRIDGQNMNNNVPIPEPLKTITSYYGMRDANWDPNFATSVKTIQKLYEQSGGGTVDGMVALNPGIMTDLLDIFGPMAMPQYGLQLTADNFVEKTQQHVESEGIKQAYNPKQLLVDFAPVIVNRLFNANAKELSAISVKILQRLSDKDILIYFTDPKLEQSINELNWGGNLSPAVGKQDYLLVSDSNLGGNKSTGSITRQVTHQVTDNNGQLTVDLSIDYKHQGTYKFPDGVNKNYVRIYLPDNIKLSRITGYDEGTKVDQTVEAERTIVGFWVTTKPQTTSNVVLRYTLPFKTDLNNYQLMTQKQPGIKNEFFVSKWVSSKDNTSRTLFSGYLTKDELITVSSSNSSK